MEDVRTTTGAIKGVNDLDVIINNYEDDLYKYDKEVRNLKYELGEKDNKIRYFLGTWIYPKIQFQSKKIK